MVHFFEFVAGFALAMMAELCWHGLMSVILGTPPHFVRFFPGSRVGGVLVHMAALVWLVLGIAGAWLLVVRLVTGAWWQALVISAGIAGWAAYAMVYYRVHEIMRAEARAHREQG